MMIIISIESLRFLLTIFTCSINDYCSSLVLISTANYILQESVHTRTCTYTVLALF